VVRLPAGTPDQIDWKTFLRIGAPLAGLVGLLTAFAALVWLVLFPANIFLAIHLYRRRQPGPLKTTQGVRMGVLLGLLTFATQALVLVAVVAHDPAGYRQQRESEMKDALAHNPSPQAEQVTQMFSGARGVALLTTIGMTGLLVFTLIIGGVSGALAASLSRNKSGP
jgi:hypothetical protein